MNRASLWRCCALVFASALDPVAGFGQANPDSVKLRNDCRLAGQVIETGHPGVRTGWAWSVLPHCTVALRIRVLNAAMHDVRTSSDLHAIQRALMPAAWLHDRVLFERLLAIAGDRNASVTARVVAFVALASIRDRWASPSYNSFIGGVEDHPAGVVIPRARCSRRIAHERGFEAGLNPLPQDYKAQIIGLGVRVSEDRSEPADVRSAAACV